jgi:hypothetical protein
VGQSLKVGNFQDSGDVFSNFLFSKRGGPRNWQFLVFGSTLYLDMAENKEYSCCWAPGLCFMVILAIFSLNYLVDSEILSMVEVNLSGLGFNDSFLAATSISNATFSRLLFPSQKTVPQAFSRKKGSPPVDILIFSKNRPLQTFALLQSLYSLGRNFSDVYVIYNLTGAGHIQAYQRLFDCFPSTHWIPQQKGEFKDKVMKTLRSSNASHFVPIVDEMVFTNEVDFAHAASVLNKHGPTGTFQLRLGENIPTTGLMRREGKICGRCCQEYGNHVNSYTLKGMTTSVRMDHANVRTNDLWYVTNVDAAMVPRTMLLQQWSSYAFNHPGDLEAHWYGFHNAFDKGCNNFFYDKSVVVNNGFGDTVREDENPETTANTTASLLNQFLSGKIIDISYFYNMNNTDVHIGTNPPLISFSAAQCPII